MKNLLKKPLEYLLLFLKWIFIAIAVGIIGGLVGTAFHKSIDFVTQLRMKNYWLIYLMPLAGVTIVFMYRKLSSKGVLDTNRVIDSVQSDNNVPFSMSPLIFVSTLLTQLFGASAGREGAALQLGGSIGYNTGKCLKLCKSDLHIVTLCGMASVFSALFGTPITATIFVLEVICVGSIHYAGFLPCIVASLTSYYIALALGISPVKFAIISPSFSIATISKTIILSLMCAVVSVVFCIAIEKSIHYMKKYLKNDYIRAFAGAVIVVLLTIALRTTDYNGAGMDVVGRAIMGEARYEAFLMKIIFTSISLAVGFKGGEIVPTMFVGATFGCVAGSLLGLDASFAAGIGLVALFCGVVNCPIASVILGIELFGSDSILFFAMACAVSFMMSGYFGLYKSQKFICSKTAYEQIDINAK